MRYFSLLSFLLLTMLFVACGNDTETAEATAETKETMEAPAEEMTGISLTPMPPTQEFPDAAITEWTYKNGTFNYVATGYEFAAPTPDASSLMCANSGKGQHAHLIVNNEPYMAKYEPTFKQDLPDGDHYILTFLSRSYHEAIKTNAAHRAVKASVKGNTFIEYKAITEPMLFYSRPKGTYVGKANTENVMLDFYPVNAPLGEYQVKVEVNGGEPLMVDNWQPYFLKGLPMGENKVTLTLMKDGAMVEAPLNPVTRTFKLEADPAGE